LPHALGVTLTDGVLDVAALTDGDDTVLVRWDPATDSVRVLDHEHEEFRAPAAAVRAVNLRGLEGGDVALVDTRLRVPLTYERGGALGALRVQLPGTGDGDDYCVATADCEAFLFTSDAAPKRRPEPGPDNGVVRGVLFGHAARGRTSGIDGSDDDMPMTGTILVMTADAPRPSALGDPGTEPVFLNPTELIVKPGTEPKGHSTTYTHFGQRLDREVEKQAEKPDGDSAKQPVEKQTAPEPLQLPQAA